MFSLKALLAVLAAMVLAVGAGCGDDDDGGDGGGATTITGAAEAGGPATTSEDARVEGKDGEAIAEVTLELLNAENGDDPCYAIVASDYVESLGGLEGCAREMGPIATGPFDTVTHAAALKGGETGEAHVESADGSQKQTIEFARTVAGEWRIDGLGGG